MIKRLSLLFVVLFGLFGTAIAAPTPVPDGTTDPCGDTEANGGWDANPIFPTQAPNTNNSATLHDGLQFKANGTVAGLTVSNLEYDTFGTTAGHTIQTPAQLQASFWFNMFTGNQNTTQGDAGAPGTICSNCIDNPTVNASWTLIRHRHPGESGSTCDTLPLQTDHLDILTHVAPSGYTAYHWIAGGMIRAQPNIVPGTVISYTAEQPQGELAWLASWLFGGVQYSPGAYPADPYGAIDFTKTACNSYRGNNQQPSSVRWWPECYYLEIDAPDSYRATSQINTYGEYGTVTAANQLNGAGYVNFNADSLYTQGGFPVPSQLYNGETNPVKIVTESSNLAVYYGSPTLAAGYHNFVLNIRKSAPIIDFLIDGKIYRSYNYQMLSYFANTPAGTNTELGMHFMITQEAVPNFAAGVNTTNAGPTGCTNCGPLSNVVSNDGLGTYGWGGKLSELIIYKGELACTNYIKVDNNASGTCADQTQANGSGGTPASTGSDEQAMAADVGAAVNAADSGALIIVQGPLNNAGLFSGSASGLNSGAPIQDLSVAQAHPVSISNKVVYSIHDYTCHLSGQCPDNGATKVTAMNNAWGSLAINNFAPVLIGELGADLDNSDGNQTADVAWANTTVSYANGTASGGPTFSGANQGLSTNWYTFGNLTGQQPDGTCSVADCSAMRAGQLAQWSQLLFSSSTPPSTGTTWNPADKTTNVVLTGNNLIATINGLSTGSGGDGVRSTSSKSSGRWCAQATQNVITAEMSIGVSNANENLTNFLGGGGSSGIGMYQGFAGGQQIYLNGTAVASGTAGNSSVGQKVTVELDATNNLIWIGSDAMTGAGYTWNNSNTANPETGTGGISISSFGGPYFMEVWSYDGSPQWTANFQPSTGCTASFGTWDASTPPPTGSSNPLITFMAQ